MFLLFSLCPLLLYRPIFQNDTYWLINTGKYIVHNGFRRWNPHLRYVRLTVGTLYMGFSSVRSFSLFVIYGIVFLAFYLKEVDPSSAMNARRRTVLVTIGIIAMIAARISQIHDYSMIKQDFKPDVAVEYMKRNIDPVKIRLYNSCEWAVI